MQFAQIAIDSELIIIGALQLVGLIVAIAIVKTDLKWIKCELKKGLRKFDEHDGKIEAHGKRLTTLETRCELFHDGSVHEGNDG